MELVRIVDRTRDGVAYNDNPAFLTFGDDLPLLYLTAIMHLFHVHSES